VAFEATGSPGGQFTIGAALGVAAAMEATRGDVVGVLVGVVVGAVVGFVVVVVVLGAAGRDGSPGGAAGAAVVVELGGSVTISAVAQGSPGKHVPPWRAAAVLRCVPAGTSAATATWNEIVSSVLVEFSASCAGRVQLSVIAFASRVRPRSARSVADVVTLA
jgi:hypothetical protein